MLNDLLWIDWRHLPQCPCANRRDRRQLLWRAAISNNRRGLRLSRRWLNRILVYFDRGSASRVGRISRRYLGDGEESQYPCGNAEEGCDKRTQGDENGAAGVFS